MEERIGILVFGAVFVDIKGYPFSLYRMEETPERWSRFMEV